MNTANGEKLRWGLIGCGWAAKDFVAPALTASSNGDLVSILDPDPEALKMFRTVAPAAEPFTEADAFFASGIDAVYVATPNHLHRPLVEAAARAGKHALCEKPMALSVEDAEAMVSACEDAGVVYATAFDQRFHARHRKLRELVEEGALGTICSARLQYACWLPPDWSPDDYPREHDNWRVDPSRAGSGALFDLAPHGLDLLQYLLDDEVSEVRAMGQRRVFDYPVEDGAALLIRFSAGTLGVHQVAYNMPDALPRRTLEIQGTEGTAISLNTMGQTPGGTLTLVSAADGGRRTVEVEPEEDRSPFLLQIEAFAGSLLSGEPFPFPPERDLATMRVLVKALGQISVGTAPDASPAASSGRS